MTVYMNNGSHRNLYLYKADTLKKLIHEAVDRVNGVVDNQEVPQEQPKEEDKKENEPGPGELSNQPLGNVPSQEENVQK